jgi:hypothetical protein
LAEGYLAFGVWVADGLTGEAVGLIGVPPGLGVPDGEDTGDGAGLARTAGVGDAGGLGGSGFGSHAPNTAVETARTVVNINDLLIVFLLITS